MKYVLAGVFIFCGIVLTSFSSLAQFIPVKNEKTNVIFDTDMGPDYDDVGAIALLHAYADSGYINILATMASTTYEGVAGVLNIFNTYYAKPDIPIGVPAKGLAYRDWQHWTDSLLHKYPHSIKLNKEAYDATQLYRKVLASQPDNSVTIITVGFLTNIAQLLMSGPDEYSALSGAALVSKKVRLMVSMAGDFPKGKQYNLQKDPASSYYVFKHWQKPVLLLGWTVGAKIKTGLQLISDNNIVNSPVKDAYAICIPMRDSDSEGRRSWDQITVMVAVKGYSPFFTIAKGKIKVKKDGSNKWRDKKNGQQAYLIEYAPEQTIAGYIEHVMRHKRR